MKVALASACLLAAAVLNGAAGVQEAKLPPETAVYRSSELPGYALTQRHCLMCHSAHYVAMQPPTSARAYWDATVKKMKKPFGAPFPDDDIPAIVDYLVRTYGAERPQATSR